MKNINIYINCVLPYILTENKDEYLDAIDKLEFLSGGVYGITFYYKDKVVKILFLDDAQNLGELEAKNVFPLFFDNLGDHINGISTSINDISHYFTTDDKIMKTISQSLKINELPKTNKEFDDTNLSTKIFGQLKKYGNIPIFALFMKKATMNFSEFLPKFQNNTTKKSHPIIISNFLKNVYDALRYMHQRNFIHNDLFNMNNIVVNVNNENYESASFQLIDFGLMQKTDNIVNSIKREPGELSDNKIYKSTTSILYDWFRILGLLENLLPMNLNKTAVHQLYKEYVVESVNETKQTEIMNFIINAIKQYDNGVYKDTKYETFITAYANFYFVLMFTQFSAKIEKNVTFYLLNSFQNEIEVEDNDGYEKILEILKEKIVDAVGNIN